MWAERKGAKGRVYEGAMTVETAWDRDAAGAIELPGTGSSGVRAIIWAVASHPGSRVEI